MDYQDWRTGKTKSRVNEVEANLVVDACRLILHHEDFVRDYVALVKEEFAIDYSDKRLTSKQVGRLLEAAALFSLNSKNEVYLKLALKIAIFLFNKYREEYAVIPFVSQLIMARMGDLPAIRTMNMNNEGSDIFSFYPSAHNDKLPDASLLDSPLFNLKFPEIAIKKISNRIRVAENDILVLTDFQSKVYRLLRRAESVAFSAPTSAGKSYVIYNHIAEQMKRANTFCTVYVVPTKALIAEVQSEINKTIVNLGIKQDEFMIYIGANFLNYDEVLLTRKKVFVLTQERLQEMLSNGIVFPVDLLVVDEAQRVKEGGRGIIIEDAVQDLITRYPSMQKVFISPYINNPEKFQNIFNTQGVIPERTSKSPVAQNFLRVDFKGTMIDVSVVSYELKSRSPQYMIPVHSRKIKSQDSPISRPQRQAWVVANLIGRDDPTLVYCDYRDQCRKTCGYIAKQFGISVISGELQKAIDFMRRYVHEEYYLIDALKNKMGYHYGKLPQFVRFYIRTLFENKEIDILCCTSTLLEGVNLPAKNIVLYDPKLGKKIAMDRLSLLNLAGRAGRLMKDHYGKIYCINQEDWKTKDDVFDDKLEDIESSAEKDLETSSDMIIAYLEDENTIREIKPGVKTLATSFIMKYLRYGNSEFLQDYKRRHPSISDADIEKIGTQLVKIARRIGRLEKEVILKNRTIDPRFQYQLYEELLRNGYKPLPCPQNGYIDGANLTYIFELIYRIILRQKRWRFYVYYAVLASKWISQSAYSELVKNKITHGRKLQNEDHKEFVNRLIDELDDDLEQKLKFDYVRGLKCYVDILTEIAHLQQVDIEICKEFPILLEAGAFDKRVLVLIGIGLSRTVAIEVYEKIIKLNGDFSTNLECVKWLRSHLDQLKVSIHDGIILNEIEDVLSSYGEIS